MNTDKHDMPEMEKEQELTPSHDSHQEEHNYDGIEELDNPPPGWIMGILYLSIALSIFYGAYYFWYKVGDQQDAEYAVAAKKYNEKYKPKGGEAGSMVMLTDEASLAAGAELYKAMNCAACHGTAAEGNAIGPNLTDEFYLHGCQFDQIFNSIKNGYPAKGMTAFKNQLSDDKIVQVTSYLMSLKGSNPANAKAAQGEKCE